MTAIQEIQISLLMAKIEAKKAEVFEGLKHRVILYYLTDKILLTSTNLPDGKLVTPEQAEEIKALAAKKNTVKTTINL